MAREEAKEHMQEASTGARQTRLRAQNTRMHTRTHGHQCPVTNSSYKKRYVLSNEHTQQRNLEGSAAAHITCQHCGRRQSSSNFSGGLCLRNVGSALTYDRSAVRVAPLRGHCYDPGLLAGSAEALPRGRRACLCEACPPSPPQHNSHSALHRVGTWDIRCA